MHISIHHCRRGDHDRLPTSNLTSNLTSSSASGAELDETDKTVRLAHHSVRKFLLEAPTQDSIPKFHFELNQANIEAGELCVAYLSFSDFERQLKGQLLIFAG